MQTLLKYQIKYNFSLSFSYQLDLTEGFFFSLLLLLLFLFAQISLYSVPKIKWESLSCSESLFSAVEM